MRTNLLVSCAATALLIGLAGANAQAPEHKTAPGMAKESPAAGPAKSAMPSEHGTAEHRSAAETPKAGKESPKADAASTANEPKSHQGAANEKGAKSERGAANEKSAPTHQGANDKASPQPNSAESTSQKPDTHRSAAETGKQSGSSATKTGHSAATGKADANKSDLSKTDTNKADAGKTDPSKTDPSKTGANTANPANTQTGRSATSTSTTSGAGDRANTTTQTGVSAQGRSGAATSVQIDAQKQERIRTTLASTKVENISHADFSVSVGTRVPERYQFHPLPTEIVDIVPEYRGFDYMVVDNEIVIVNPSTREIVYTMSEGRSAGMNRPSVDCR
jgi:Protein of unknown function (DUF1236)